LYFVLLLAVVFYAALFMAWSTMQPQLDAAAPVLISWRQILLSVPDQNVLVILKEMIALTIAYIVIDFVMTLVRRHMRRKAMRSSSYHEYPNQPQQPYA
ncbi:MAG TPA: hypothetical protein VF719_03995, partial [Abditibacteriaceae bacterium]|jgi:uncharacterized metal-binding protein